MSDFVLFEQRGGVAIVTINRPDRMNALGHEVRTGLVDAFLKIRHEPSICRSTARARRSRTRSRARTASTA